METLTVAETSSKGIINKHFGSTSKESDTESQMSHAERHNTQFVNEINFIQTERKNEMYEAVGKKNIKTKSGMLQNPGIFSNMSSVFSERHSHLLNQCKVLNRPSSTILLQHFVDLAPGPFRLCFISKVRVQFSHLRHSL